MQTVVRELCPSGHPAHHPPMQHGVVQRLPVLVMAYMGRSGLGEWEGSPVPPTVVGSRVGAVPEAGPFPTPATSNRSCGFPASGFPADFTPRPMRPTATTTAAGTRPAPPCPRDAPSLERLGLHRAVQRPSQRLADCRAALSAAPASAILDDHLSAVGALRSAGITPCPHYYSPVRHPLVSPSTSRAHRLYDGASSRAFRPGTRRASPVAGCVLRLRAAGSTPPR